MTNKHTDAPGYSTFSGKEVSGGGGQSAGEAIATEQLRWHKTVPKPRRFERVFFESGAVGAESGWTQDPPVLKLQQLWLVDGVEEWRDVPEVEE